MIKLVRNLGLPVALATALFACDKGKSGGGSGGGATGAAGATAIAPAQGVSSGGRIRLMPGLSKAEEFSVMAHELAHEMLHHGKDAPRPPKAVRETQAEAVAFVVCRGVGLETSTAAADYIALYNGDKATLAKSLSVIQETSAKILDELLPERAKPIHHAEANVTFVDRESHPSNPAPAHHPTPAASADSTHPSQESATWDR